MTLNTGHPEIKVAGTLVDGDADIEFREYLVERLALGDLVDENANGSELEFNVAGFVQPDMVGQEITGTFFLYWDDDDGEIRTTKVKLKGTVCLREEDVEEGVSYDEFSAPLYLLVKPDDVEHVA